MATCAIVLALWAATLCGCEATVVVVLGDPDDHLMTLRMQAANQFIAEHPGTSTLVLSGNTKHPQKDAMLGHMADQMARMVRSERHLRGAGPNRPPCVVQERASNNTAQHLVCTGRVLEQLRLDDEDRVVVTNKFHRRRVRSFLDLMSGRDPRWAAARIVAAENSLAVSWRARDEADRFMDRVESDLDGAMRADCRARSATCAALW